jgi:hypothetical protein
LKLSSAVLVLPIALIAAGPRVRPSPRPFSLATLPRIRLEAARDHLVVVHDASVPRGQWPGGDLDLYVAFGAPGAPRAIDARVFAGGEGAGAGAEGGEAERDPPVGATSETVSLERAPRRPTGVYPLLGSSTMAGVILHVREAAFRRAVGPFGVARLRIRALYDLPHEDARGGREVVVRLGTQGGEPLALGRLEIVSLEGEKWIVRAEAHLCGPEADPYPLTVSVLPGGARLAESPGGSGLAPEAPALSVRHSSDDLCVRFWTL